MLCFDLLFQSFNYDSNNNNRDLFRQLGEKKWLNHWSVMSHIMPDWSLTIWTFYEYNQMAYKLKCLFIQLVYTVEYSTREMYLKNK